MDIREYQLQANETDQVPGSGEKSLVVPLLGLAGEAGSLLTEYKKHLRDGDAYRLFTERIAEELGDILWYVSNIATKAGLDLAAVAEGNLAKVRDRWLSKKGPSQPTLFDEDFPAHEQLPRQFRISFTETAEGASTRVHLIMDGHQIGDQLTDNAYTDDAYRFHDAFHFAYAAVLGWSPVTRKLLDCKRKSKPDVDEVEDGGRASVIEEGIAALVFAYARGHSFLEGVIAIDYELLRTLRTMTSHLEVRQRSLHQWQQAILEGYRVWRLIRDNAGGTLIGDLRTQVITYEPN